MKKLDVSLIDVLQNIVAERIRQIEEEGFDYANDDLYTSCELAQAASAYAGVASQCETARKIRSIPGIWPVSWDDVWFKPTTPRQDLVKAAALIVAEIQRLDRLEKNRV